VRREPPSIERTQPPRATPPLSLLSATSRALQDNRRLCRLYKRDEPLVLCCAVSPGRARLEPRKRPTLSRGSDGWE
jgi:hypothetical protein